MVQNNAIETARLRILPLSHAQLIKYSRLPDTLMAELRLKPYKRIIPEALKAGLENKIIPNVKNDPDNIYFITLWSIISKDLNVIVGDLCFKGKPDSHGEVEIGYGTYDDFINNGFMTEAVGGLTAWALNRREVSGVVAETRKDNIASHKILMKNGFTVFSETQDMFWWSRKKY